MGRGVVLRSPVLLGRHKATLLYLIYHLAIVELLWTRQPKSFTLKTMLTANSL